jgi:hypothetical protein
MTMMADDDPFGAFGEDDDEDQSPNDTPNHVSLFLTRHFLKVNAQIPLNQRCVGIVCADDDDPWSDALASRGIQVKLLQDDSTASHNDACLDAVLVCTDIKEVASWFPMLERALVNGGVLLYRATVMKGSHADDHCFSKLVWDINNNFYVNQEENTGCVDNIRVVPKRAMQIQEETCPWLPTTHSLEEELDRVAKATVIMSVLEMISGKLTEQSIQYATKALSTYGYCILPGLLVSQKNVCTSWGSAVLNDLRAAADILKEQGVDLYNPSASTQEPDSYRELSMREDLRMDLRDGPLLRMLRPMTVWTVTSETNVEEADHFFRGNVDMLEIVRRTMNPKDESLSKGNFGRYNFSGSGPDGSFQVLRVGPVGGIISLPGVADQALHADTPHLFEHMATLPAHYINAFTPGCAAATGIGQTAFVHGSHKLDITAEYFKDDNQSQIPVNAAQYAEVWKQLVRPKLDLGDVLLFDCRILHFGLANTSTDIQRPLLYTNMTMHWFNDPKNWEQDRPIFELEHLRPGAKNVEVETMSKVLQETSESK